MAYESPRDELLLAILIAVAATTFDSSFGPFLAGVAAFVGIGAYAVAAFSVE